MGPLDVHALEASPPGRLGIGGEEKPGRHVRERQAPPKPAQPGRRARRAHEDSRRGTRVWLHSLAVATGQRAGPMGATRKTAAGGAPLQPVEPSVPPVTRSGRAHGPCAAPWAPGRLAPGGPVVPGAFGPHEAENGCPVPGVSGGSQPSAGRALHAQTRRVALASRVGLWRLPPTLFGPRPLAQGGGM
jgi:hypothetical protein